MMTNTSVGHSNAPQETATDSGYVGLQANISTVGLCANKYIALNREWNITGNYAVRMHKTLKHQCVHYTPAKICCCVVNVFNFKRFSPISQYRNDVRL